MIRTNRCQALAPSERAACSWSRPSSSSTGTSSRTTSGSDTKQVASTMPGSAKMTCTPAFDSDGPNQPSVGP